MKSSFEPTYKMPLPHRCLKVIPRRFVVLMLLICLFDGQINFRKQIVILLKGSLLVLNQEPRLLNLFHNTWKIDVCFLQRINCSTKCIAGRLFKINGMRLPDSVWLLTALSRCHALQDFQGPLGLTLYTGNDFLKRLVF